MLTLFHDYTSPASAIAVARTQRLAAEGLDIRFEGFEAIGLDLTVPVTRDVAAEIERLAPLAADESITLRRPAGLPPTGPCHVAARVAQRAGLDAAWRSAAYRALWRDGADLSDHGVLQGLAAEVGLDPGALRQTLADRAELLVVRRRTVGLRGEGVGGVPTILAQRTLVPGLLPEADLRTLAAL